MKHDYNYDYKYDVEKFSELFNTFTGVPKGTIKKYLKDENNSIENMLNHPGSLTQNVKQLEKINQFKEFKSIYDNLTSQFGKNKYNISSPNDVYEYIANKLKGIRDKEYVSCTFLDTKNSVIKTEILGIGTINQAIVDQREIIKKALLYDAKGIILAHNHPSGNPKPSLEDIAITANIRDTGEKMSINILDHLIIGENNYISVKESLNHIGEDLSDLKVENTRHVFNRLYGNSGLNMSRWIYKFC